MVTTKRSNPKTPAARSRAATARRVDPAPKAANTQPRVLAAAVSAALLPWGTAYALPAGESVVHGDVTISRPTTESM